VIAGSIALVSQSGATASYIASFASQFGIEFTHMVSTGNEADLNAARIVQYLVDDPRVKAIALFLETVRARDVFIEAAGSNTAPQPKPATGSCKDVSERKP